MTCVSIFGRGLCMPFPFLLDSLRGSSVELGTWPNGSGIGLRRVASARIQRKSIKADSTLRTSRAVPHPSTNRALCRLTSEVERDPVHSTRYGRQRKHMERPVDPKNRDFFFAAAEFFFRRPAMLATARRAALVPADVADCHRHHRDDHRGGG